MKTIELGRDLRAIVDDGDLERLYGYTWNADVRKTGHIYAVRKLPRNGASPKKVYMHHDVAGKAAGMVVDHINRNTLDNRKENLRLVSQQANVRNQKIRTDNKTGFRGVRFKPERQKWHAYIRTKPGRNGWKHLGYFADIKAAAKSRADAEAVLWASPQCPSKGRGEP